MARAKKPGRTLAVVPRRSSTDHSQPKPDQKSEAKAEAIPELQDLIVPAALLLAAETVSAKNDANRMWLQTVYLHSVNGKGRVAATDGNRMFISSFAIAGEAPAWLADGLLLANDGIKAVVSMIAKGASSGAKVRVRYAKGLPKAELSDLSNNMLFRCETAAGEFPDYERVIPAETFVRLDEDGNPIGSEWEPIGINSQYLKHIGEIAKILEASLPKDERSKKGMVVRAYNASGGGDKPLVFDFDTWPGAILIIMPAKLANASVSVATAALLAPQIKLTIAALRAHATRNLQRAEDTDDPQEKAAALAKADGFNARIAEILKRAPGFTAIGPAAESEPEPAPSPASEDAGLEPEPEAEGDEAVAA